MYGNFSKRSNASICPGLPDTQSLIPLLYRISAPSPQMYIFRALNIFIQACSPPRRLAIWKFIFPDFNGPKLAGSTAESQAGFTALKERLCSPTYYGYCKRIFSINAVVNLYLDHWMVVSSDGFNLISLKTLVPGLCKCSLLVRHVEIV